MTMPTLVSTRPFTAKVHPKRDLSKIDHVRGRVCDSTGAVNLYGRIDTVHLRDYDSNTGHVILRCDHAALPEFWLEIPLSLKQLREWIREQEEDGMEGEEEGSDDGRS
jgi:hypothetical protein